MSDETVDAPHRAARAVLVTLATAQFVMVLDQAVMNVSISQLVADFDTEVTTIQGVITLYSLVMAALMITIGLVIGAINRSRPSARARARAAGQSDPPPSAS